MENLQLQTLRTLVRRKNSFSNNRFVTSYKACQSLIIPIDKWLQQRGYTNGTQRRDIRLYMYSAITQRDCGSTFDLYTIELGTIRSFIEEPVTYAITDDGNALFIFLEKEYHDGSVPYTSGSDDKQPETSTAMPDMSEAPF